MKTSISVPDELWSEAVLPGESPSQVVQHALRALLDQRAGASTRIEGNQSEARLLEILRGSGGAEATLDSLSGQAVHLARLGYAIGVDAARAIPWTSLERFTSVSTLRDELTHEYQFDVSNLPEDIIRAVWQSIHDFEDPVTFDENKEPILGPTLTNGIAEGLIDVCDAVRQRLANAPIVETPGANTETEAS